MSVLGPRSRRQLALLARLRARFPLLFVLPGLLLGQYLGYLTLLASGCLVAIFLCAAYFLGVLHVQGASVFRWSFVVGVLSTMAYSTISQQMTASDVSYLASAITSPQRPRVGEVRLGLEFVGVISSQGVTELQAPIRASCKAVDLPWRNVSAVRKGAHLATRANLHAIRPGLNPFSYDATAFRHGFSHACKIRYLAVLSQDPHDWLYSLRQALKQSVFSILGDGESAGLVLAMSVGVRDVISDETEDAFKRTGLAHLLVASGYQITLFFVSAATLLRHAISLFSASRRYSFWVTLVPVISFLLSVILVVIVGAEGSIVRALFSVLFLVIARIFERGGGFFNSILFSFVCTSILWPGAYFEPGIQLTFGALCGLALADSLELDRLVARYLAACFFASLLSSFVSLAWFGRFSWWTFLLNPIVAPLGSVIGCNLGLLAILSHSLYVDSGGMLLKICAWGLERYRDWICLLADSEWGSFEIVGVSRVLVLAVVFLFVAEMIRRRIHRYRTAFNLR